MGGRGASSATALGLRGSMGGVLSALSAPEGLQGTVYEKPRESLTDDERAGVDQLEAAGIHQTVNAQNDGNAANIDLTIDGELYEMKNVTSASSVSTQFNRARKQFFKLKVDHPPRFVFTTQRSSLPFDRTVEEVEKRMREGERAIVLSPNGDFANIER